MSSLRIPDFKSGSINEDEYRTHFCLWAILAAPLIAGNDLTTMTLYTEAMLANREIIAVDQDPLGKQGFRVAQQGPFEVWMKPMADGSKVVGLFNRQRTSERMTVRFSEIGIAQAAEIRDLWVKKLWVRSRTNSARMCPPTGLCS
jgi:alpha-galactosidase